MGCHALVAVNALVKDARRVRRPNAAVAAGDACIARLCRRGRFEVSRHVMRQFERIEAVLMSTRTLVARPDTSEQASVSTLSAAEAADALTAAAAAALAELPNGRALVAAFSASRAAPPPRPPSAGPGVAPQR